MSLIGVHRNNYNGNIVFREYILNENFNKSKFKSLANLHLRSKQLESIQQLLVLTIFNLSSKKLLH